MNLSVSPKDVIQVLRQEWMANDPLADWPEALVQRLVGDKFGTKEFIWRR
jgi:hypothetical protein